MSIRLNTFIKIISPALPQGLPAVKDAEGFAVWGETVIASVRAYKEERHGSVAWKNRAAFSTATALFRFRVIPGVTVSTAMVIVCGGERYNIVSVEDVKGRGMYIEILCERVNPSGQLFV